MIYDRPVRELLDECAAELSKPFTEADVIAWFRERYPKVQASTVTTQIAGLTAGRARNHAFLATKPPVLERVGKGLYRRARAGAAGAGRQTVGPKARSLAPGPTARKVSAVVLIGCVKSKLTQAAPAQDLYTGALFARRRSYAERSGLPWFVISSRWGLVAPTEVIAPYDLYLNDLSSAYRRSWADFVAAQLAARLELPGIVIEVHAGTAYVNALRPALERLGAVVVVVDAVQVGSMGETLAWHDEHSPGDATRTAAPTDDLDVDRLVAYLRDATRSMTPADLRISSRIELSRPGLYSWWVDESGARDLSRGLDHALAPGLIYAGLAGATRWPSGKASSNTLWGRLIGMHLGGRANLSTFRLTLGSILCSELWAGTLDEESLTAWMHDHLRVIPCPVEDADTLGHVETAVLGMLDPPLNLSKMASSPIRLSVSQLRRKLPK